MCVQPSPESTTTPVSRPPRSCRERSRQQRAILLISSACRARARADGGARAAFRRPARSAAPLPTAPSVHACARALPLSSGPAPASQSGPFSFARPPAPPPTPHPTHTNATTRGHRRTYTHRHTHTTPTHTPHTLTHTHHTHPHPPHPDTHTHTPQRLPGPCALLPPSWHTEPAPPAPRCAALARRKSQTCRVAVARAMWRQSEEPGPGSVHASLSREGGRCGCLWPRKSSSQWRVCKLACRLLFHPRPSPTPHDLRRVLPVLRRVEGRLREDEGVLRGEGRGCSIGARTVRGQRRLAGPQRRTFEEVGQTAWASQRAVVLAPLPCPLPPTLQALPAPCPARTSSGKIAKSL